MNVSEFDYELPPERIAQHPLARRDDSRLLVLDRERGTVRHRSFRDLPALLLPGDLLVFNDTRVIPARLVGSKPSGGRVELLLTEVANPAEPHVWRCMIRSAPPEGTPIAFGEGLTAVVLTNDDQGPRVRLESAGGEIPSLLERVGQTPLPPYIRRAADGESTDRSRYQTVFAERPGAVAAPTAGLHFSRELLAELERSGVEQARVTLHVGPGTFLPVRSERIEDHRMHSERYEVPAPTVAAVVRAQREGRRVVAVGTTVVRALESAADSEGGIRPAAGRCNLFIRPGYRFRSMDAMITNFHLPRSTLLMLVCAFAGREKVLEAYREAVRCGYRFYSYGDAMLIGGD